MIARMGSSAKPREIVIVVYPGVQSLDLTGPLEVFAGAQLLLDSAARGAPAAGHGRGYRITVLSRDGGSLKLSGTYVAPAFNTAFSADWGNLIGMK